MNVIRSCPPRSRAMTRASQKKIQCVFSGIKHQVFGWFPSNMDTLTHCGQVRHICISKLTIIGSDNGLAPDWQQAIIWTNSRVFLIQSIGTNFNQILSKIHTFSFKKMHLNMSSGKLRLFCLTHKSVCIYIISRHLTLKVLDCYSSTKM